jgi:hypothetical protein
MQSAPNPILPSSTSLVMGAVAFLVVLLVVFAVLFVVVKLLRRL